MGNKEWVMPTHIIAGAGIVINENDEVLLVKTYDLRLCLILSVRQKAEFQDHLLS